MKAILLITLLTLSTYSYAATLSSPSTSFMISLTNADKADLMKKAGKTIVSLGKILRNDPSSITAEDRENAIEALKALNTFQTERDPDSEEYFWGDLLKDVIINVVKGGVSAAVSTGVDAAIQKG
ncbi:uncharacterized protein LOC144167504 [Haemaphysalis longicornis]